MAKKTVKVGVIGTGGIATVQAKSLSKLEGVEIVAGCDIDPEHLKTFCDTYGVEKRFEDYNDLVRLPELDAVTVCTPNYVHKDPTIAALKAGKHTMVEKPMAMNAAEAQAMIDAETGSGKTLTMGFQFRLRPDAQALKRFANDGRLGKVLFVRCQALRRRGIPSWGVFGQKHLQGGGPLIDIGVHIIECAHFLMGEPRPVAASAQTYTYLGNKKPVTDAPWGNWDWETYTVEDLAVGMIRFENGAVMSIESSFVAHIKENVFTCQLMGEKGGCLLTPTELYTDDAGVMVDIEPSYVGKWDSMDRKISDWIGRVRGEVETQCPSNAGLMVQKILDGLYASAEAGREVAID
ncbi:MAG: Gfo/Idh/MocA family oxidoreductase [Candidatus Brocadiaceae bacterium]|nr:Gfo/Idh/MocA family oxidoreductase [Candidatus Brocadiaceae bacterium]